MKPICAVKDLAVQAFGTPFTTRSRGEALRSFKDEVNRTDGQSAVANHPEDFELYEVGHFHDDTGELTCTTPPELIARAKDLKQGA
ncbi:MAG: nonstructural protein [Microvirus sp.]|nr:MAG: nonstructural protein [Microvirus sp.]